MSVPNFSNQIMHLHFKATVVFDKTIETMPIVKVCIYISETPGTNQFSGMQGSDGRGNFHSKTCLFVKAPQRYITVK